MNQEIARLKNIWNEWSQNLVSFKYVQDNNYLVETKFMTRNNKPISFNLFFDEDGIYRMRYQKEKKILEVNNIKEENLPAEILRFALMIDN
ncbi:hypothetical protein [Lactobacillus hominis]|uniref:Uncharacterized protein n=1 Tax=Lactobacillus hominis DSM 23910 = CRBIP 24.179 TaxID=1423758 RepID=I7KGT4_9LACO|nr:hypothetical protein [Lactobacillus hominis]KRM85925.1 hypothetical protein FC41_GL000118 [Lactobacillus hominis DSM 23910 = CRBIP 24.179]MCT3348842.1 hypothetical protein [Lactobacillus hominis]CCI81520.1 Protein of unknown function [Lactobacillus hominis DSM 23910 = CRBIP 24.179]